MSILNEYKNDLRSLYVSLLENLGIVMIAETPEIYEDSPRLVMDVQFTALITDDTVDYINNLFGGIDETINSQG